MKMIGKCQKKLLLWMMSASLALQAGGYPSSVQSDRIPSLSADTHITSLPEKRTTMQEKVSDFGELSRLCGELIRRWDDPVLGLTLIQKEKLGRVHRETASAIRSYTIRAKKIKERINKTVLDSNDSVDQNPEISILAALKKELMLIDLRCVSAIKKILTPQQFTLLKTVNSSASDSPRGCRLSH